MPARRVHILCFGNPLHGDDGFGPAVAMALRRLVLPEGVHVFDCATRGLDALGFFENCDEVIIVDTMLGEQPGRVRSLSPNEIPVEPASVGGHGAGVGYLLASLREMIAMPSTTVIAAEITEARGFSPGLSIELAAGVSEAVERIVERWRGSAGGGLELADEVEVLREANHALEQELVASSQMLETMISSQEQQSEKLQHSVREITRLQGAIERAFVTMTEILVVLSPDGTVQRVSAMLERDLGYSAASVRGQYLEIALAEEAREYLRDVQGESLDIESPALLLNAIRSSNGPFEAELNFERKGAGAATPAIPYLVRGNLLHSPAGKLEGAVIVATNILGLKTREQALQENQKRLREAATELAAHRDNLAAMVEAQTHDLRVSKEAAEAASRAKSEFLSNMSHEVRTPLNAIVGMSELCLRTALHPQQKNYVTKIRRAADHLLGIINDILDFSKIEAGKLGIEQVSFDMSMLLDEVTHLLIERIEEKGLEFGIDVDPDTLGRFVGDPLRMRQVIINLLGNAVKFSERGTLLLKVRASAGDSEHVELHFEVHDEGIGISPEQQVQLFSAFSQADMSTTRRYGGSGLGLAISKRIVECMDGRMWLESEPGRGSAFHFTVRLRRGAAGDSALEVVANSLGATTADAVLVADDNPLVAEILAAECRQLGFSARIAANRTTLFEALAQPDRPCLAIIDAGLAEGDENGFVADIRRHLSGAALPILLTVTHAAYLRLGGRGPDDTTLVAKPCLPEALGHAIASSLGMAMPDDANSANAASAARWDFSAVEDLQGADILVVDDIDLNRDLMRDLLETAGLKVRLANDGREAIEAVRAQRPLVVLMDCQMPVMDGFAATRVLRAQPEYRDLPIIALTAGVLAEDREQCLLAGMNSHVTKPVDLDILLGEIQRLAGRKPAARGETVSSAAPMPPPAPSPTAVSSGDGDDFLPELPGINVAKGLELVRNKVPFYRRMLGKFREIHGEAFVADIEAALAAGDLVAAARLAHSLKGVSRNLGIDRLGELAATVESELKGPGASIAPASLPDLLAELSRVREGLKALG